LIRSPARASCTTSVAQPENDSFLIFYIGMGLLRSSSSSESTKELCRATIYCRFAGGISTR